MEKLFFKIERAEAILAAFENPNYHESAMASAHLGFCMECYSIYYYDNEDSMRTASPKETTPTGAFLDVAVDHGLVFPHRYNGQDLPPCAGETALETDTRRDR